jgi:hypothetical protein
MTSNNTTTLVHNSLSIRSILDRDKLNSTNFLDWFRNLRIVLKHEKKSYVLEGPVSDPPASNATKAIKDAWAKHLDDASDVSCLMLASMIPELQKSFELHTAYDMIEELKQMFVVQSRQERYETVTAFIGCKMQGGSHVSAHVLKMKAYVAQLSRLGFPISDELATDIILHSLPKSFNQFVLNYNMNNLEKSISELHSMLKTAEGNMPNKGSQVLMIRDGRVKKPTNRPNDKGKGKGKWKGKGKKDATKSKQVAPKVVPKDKVAKDHECFHCGGIGHWKRNCPKYLSELKNKRATDAGTSGIYVIELYAFSTNSWVFDTGCGTHICNDVQGLRNARQFKSGDLELHVGNGARVAVEAVGTYHLLLPNGLYLILNNCCYVPSLTRNIISAYRLYEQGYVPSFQLNGNISLSMNSVFYFNACPNNGIYEIDMHSSYKNNSIYS